MTGDDLTAAGLNAGPVFKRVLDAVYDAQLEDRVKTKEEAMCAGAGLAAEEENEPHASRRATLSQVLTGPHRGRQLVHGQTFFISRLALCPPKPKLLLIATSTFWSRALCGT